MPTPFDLIGNIKCPVYGFFGNLDKNPSPDDADKFEATLQRHKIPHRFHRYSNADHGFQNPARSHPRTTEELKVADEAWATMLDQMNKKIIPLAARQTLFANQAGKPERTATRRRFDKKNPFERAVIRAPCATTIGTDLVPGSDSLGLHLRRDLGAARAISMPLGWHPWIRKRRYCSHG